MLVHQKFADAERRRRDASDSFGQAVEVRVGDRPVSPRRRAVPDQIRQVLPPLCGPFPGGIEGGMVGDVAAENDDAKSPSGRNNGNGIGGCHADTIGDFHPWRKTFCRLIQTFPKRELPNAANYGILRIMPILIDDADLEARLLAIGDSQAIPAPHKATVARVILDAACEAYESGDLTRLHRLLQLHDPIIRVAANRRPDPEAWRPELERSDNGQ